MGLIQAIVYGIVQGLTEFLPISSSGHLLFLPAVLGWEDPGAGFTAVIQIGTVAAVLIFFRRELWGCLRDWAASLLDKSKRGTEGAILGWAIVLGTLPIVVLGLLLEEKIDTAFRSPLVVAGMLVGVALVMFAAEKIGKRERALETVRIKDGIIIGLWQVLALVPGASRSGATIAGGMFAGFDRPTAAKFSFLLSVPSVLGAGVYKLIKDVDKIAEAGVVETVVATLVAFATGYAAIAFLIRYLQTHSTVVFVVYRIALGATIVALVAQGIID